MSSVNAWRKAFALEDAAEAPVAEFNIEVNPDDFAEDGTVIDPVTNEGEEPLEVVAADMAEEEGEIEATEDTIEDLEQTAEAFESAAIALECAINERGGMTPTEIALLRMGLENRTFHNHEIRSIVPSPEAASRNRIGVSNEALDSIKDGITAIWEQIKEQIKKLYSKLKNWWLKTFDAAPRLRKKAEAIQKKAEKTKGGPKDKKIDLSLGKTLADAEGKVASDGGTIIKNSAAVEELTSIILGGKDYDAWIDNADTSATLVLAMAEAFAVSRNGSQLTSAMQNNQISKLASQINTLIGSMNFTPAKPNYFDPTVYDYNHCDLFGGKSYYAMKGLKTVNIESATDFKNFLMSFAPRFENTYKKPKSVDNSLSFPVLTTTEVSTVCDHAITVANIIEDYRKKWDKREKARNAIEKAVDSQLKEFKSSNKFQNDASGRSMVIEGVKGVSSIVNCVVGTEQKVASYAISTFRALLTYCSRSLSNHKE